MAPESNAKTFNATVGSRSIIPDHCPSATPPKHNKSAARREPTPTLVKSAIRVLLLEDPKLEEETEPGRGVTSSALPSTVQLAVRDRTNGDQVAMNLRRMGIILVRASPLRRMKLVQRLQLLSYYSGGELQAQP